MRRMLAKIRIPVLALSAAMLARDEICDRVVGSDCNSCQLLGIGWEAAERQISPRSRQRAKSS